MPGPGSVQIFMLSSAAVMVTGSCSGTALFWCYESSFSIMYYYNIE